MMAVRRWGICVGLCLGLPYLSHAIPPPPGYDLTFVLGGSITGEDYTIRVTPNLRVSFRQVRPERSRPVRSVERALSSVEFQQIQAVIEHEKLFTLPSQDFAAEPLIPDQGSYLVTLRRGTKSHQIQCGLPRPQRSLNQCQRQIGKLRELLDQVLGVTMQ